MAKAWIRDRWLKSKAVVDGVELTPTTGMKRQVAANRHRRSAAPPRSDTGRHAWRSPLAAPTAGSTARSLPTREAAEARAANQR